MLRGCKVLRDADFAALYQGETRVLMPTVKRDLACSPGEFMFPPDPDQQRDHACPWCGGRNRSPPTRISPPSSTRSGSKLLTHNPAITEIVHAIRRSMTPLEPATRHPIGFGNPRDLQGATVAGLSRVAPWKKCYSIPPSKNLAWSRSIICK